MTDSRTFAIAERQPFAMTDSRTLAMKSRQTFASRNTSAIDG